MVTRSSAARRSGCVLACIALSAAAPALATQARLVHCGDAETCLRLSGHRAHTAVAVQVAGRDLPVEGGRNWRIDVPLGVARLWHGVARDRMTVTLADGRTDGRRSETVLLPPGAMAGKVELAELVIARR